MGELDLEGAAGVARVLGLAGDVAELVYREVAVEVRSQVHLLLVPLQRPQLLLLQARAVRVYLEAESLRREVLEFAVYQADL